MDSRFQQSRNTSQSRDGSFPDGSGLKLSESELIVLECLFDTTHAYGEFCTNFKLIARKTELPICDIRMACRSLAELRLAEFRRGLMTEDGEVAGSGYCITAAGREVIEPVIDARESALSLSGAPHV